MKIVLCLPVYQKLEKATERSLNAAVDALCIKQVVRMDDTSGIAKVRSMIATGALAFRPDAMLWVDADMEFTVTDAVRLVRFALDFDCDVVGSNYRDRLTTALSWLPIETANYTFGEGGCPVAASKCGFGLTVTLPTAFERAEVHAPKHREQPHWFAEERDWDTGICEQEDHSFCRRVLRGGGRVMVDTGVCPGHITPRPVYWYTEEMETGRPVSGVVRVEDHYG